MITESEAREMKAGAELDRICAEWLMPEAGEMTAWVCCGGEWRDYLSRDEPRAVVSIFYREDV